EVPNGIGIQIPRLVINRHCVRVDQDLAGRISFLVFHHETTEMELGDCSGRQRVDVGVGVVAEIDGADVNVAYVAEEPTSGPSDKLGKKLDLGHRRLPETEIVRRVLD